MGNAVQACRIDGSGFVSIQECSTDEFCLERECVPIETSQQLVEENRKGANVLTVEESGEGSDGGGAMVVPPPYVFPGTLLRLQFQIENSVEGGLIDIGFCGGVPAVNVFHAMCSKGVFLRIEDKGLALEATFWNGSNEDSEPIEVPGTQVLLDESQAYTLSLSLPPVEEGGETVPVTLSFYGVSAGASFQTTTLMAPADLVAFGLWNYDTASGPEAALSGSLIQASISHSDLVNYELLDFLEFATTEAFAWEDSPNSQNIGFYVSGEQRNSALFSMEYLRN